MKICYRGWYRDHGFKSLCNSEITAASFDASEGINADIVTVFGRPELVDVGTIHEAPLSLQQYIFGEKMLHGDVEFVAKGKMADNADHEFRVIFSADELASMFAKLFQDFSLGDIAAILDRHGKMPQNQPRDNF